MKNNKKPAKSISLHTSTTTFSIHNSVLHTQSDFLFRSVLISNWFDFCLAIFNFLCLLFGQHLHLFVVLIASCPTFFCEEAATFALVQMWILFITTDEKNSRPNQHQFQSFLLSSSFFYGCCCCCVYFSCVCGALCMRMLFFFSFPLSRSLSRIGRDEKKIETWNERQHRHTISQYEDSNLIRALCGSIVTFKFAIVRTHGHTHS